MWPPEVSDQARSLARSRDATKFGNVFPFGFNYRLLGAKIDCGAEIEPLCHPARLPIAPRRTDEGDSRSREWHFRGRAPAVLPACGPPQWLKVSLAGSFRASGSWASASIDRRSTNTASEPRFKLRGNVEGAGVDHDTSLESQRQPPPPEPHLCDAAHIKAMVTLLVCLNEGR